MFDSRDDSTGGVLVGKGEQNHEECDFGLLHLNVHRHFRSEIIVRMLILVHENIIGALLGLIPN